MFTRYTVIVRLLLLCCIVLRSCRSSLTQLNTRLMPPEKTADFTDLRRSYRSFWPFIWSDTETHDTVPPNSDGVLTDQKANTADNVPSLEVDEGNGDRERNYVRVAQGEISRAADKSLPLEEEVDLSILDDLETIIPLLEAEISYCNSFYGYLLSIFGLCTVTTSTIAQSRMENENPSFDPDFYGLNRQTDIETDTELEEAYLLSDLGSSNMTDGLQTANADSQLTSKLLAELDFRNVTVLSDKISAISFNSSEVSSVNVLPDNYHQNVNNNSNNYSIPIVSFNRSGERSINILSDNYSDNYQIVKNNSNNYDIFSVSSNHSGLHPIDTLSDNYHQTVKNNSNSYAQEMLISNDSLPIRVTDLRGNGKIIKNRKTAQNSVIETIYSGYSKVRQLNNTAYPLQIN